MSAEKSTEPAITDAPVPAQPAPTDTHHVQQDVAVENAPAPFRAGGDEALAMVGEQQHVYDPAVASRAVRKIDWFFMPAMLFGCVLILSHLFFYSSQFSQDPSLTLATVAGPQTAWSTTTRPFSAPPSSSV